MTMNKRLMRSIPSKFETRESESGEISIEAYFAVFDSDYVLWDGPQGTATERIASGAFSDCLNQDIRALVDHDTRIVLGRSNATTHTLILAPDEHGLFGKIIINQNDVDAMNLYARVKRGDVSQCSIGFQIAEQTETIDGNNVCWTLEKIDPLYEVSIVTFPAYESTSAEARKNDFENIKKRKTEAWKASMLKNLRR